MGVILSSCLCVSHCSLNTIPPPTHPHLPTYSSLTNRSPHYTTRTHAGYDLIIDQDLKPWLLEVNASPSLSANTREDYLMKCEMLNGMLDVVDMEEVLSGDEEHVSGELDSV